MSNKQFFLLVKPASADCNLRCSYCFYLDKKELYSDRSCHRMSEEVLERLISSYMKTNQNQYSISWQGGEPTLMGIDFFKRVVALEMIHGKKGDMVANALQTNGTLIDEELAEHLAKYKFLVGVSLDGPEDIHNKYRFTAGGDGSYSGVINGIDLLKKHNIEFNGLSLVSSTNVNRGKEVYKYLCRSKIYYHQYTPCVEFDDNGKPLEYTITGKQWGKFLCQVFDEWYKKDVNRVSVRLFDSILMSMLYGKSNMCCMDKNCSQYLVVEHNGDVYPCDFFVEEHRKLGNIMDNSWEELLEKQEYLDFGYQKACYNEKCSKCDYVRYCAGDCLKNRFYNSLNPSELSYLCEGWKMFYKHAIPRLESIARQIRRENERLRLNR